MRLIGMAIPLLVLTAAVPTGGQPVGVLESRIESLRETWGVPGMAVAIVRGDSVLVARGFGVAEVSTGDLVGAHTLFALGSTTKAFTAMTVALLVGEGRLGWDDRVVDRLPGFELRDPWVTRAITIRDLLGHRSGLPMANLMWLSGLHDGDALLRRLRHLEAASGFREMFTYQNLLYLAVGRIVERVSGRSWDDFVADRILAPLDMLDTRTGLSRVRGTDHMAAPHARLDGVVRPVPYRNIDAIGPAGSILSGANDMARWLRFQLGVGTIGEHPFLEAETLAEIRRPQIPIRQEGPLSVFYPDARDIHYAMGWVVSEYRGRRLLDHGGGIDGMTSLVALLPEEGLGVAVLTNIQSAVPPFWLLYPMLDLLLDEEPIDRTGSFRELDEAVRASIEQPPSRRSAAPPSLPRDAYVGSYSHPALGTAVVRQEGEGLVFGFGDLEGPLDPWHFDTFRIEWADPAWRAAAGPGWVNFRIGRDGIVEGFELTATPAEHWNFERVDRENAASGLRRRSTARPRHGQQYGNSQPNRIH